MMIRAIALTLLITITAGEFDPLLQKIEVFNLDLITAACYGGADYSVIVPRRNSHSFNPKDCSPLIMEAKNKFSFLVENYKQIISNTLPYGHNTELIKSFNLVCEEVRQPLAKFLLENKHRETEIESIAVEFNHILSEMRKNIQINEENAKNKPDSKSIDTCDSISELIDTKMEKILKELKKVEENDQYVSIVRKFYAGNIENLKYLVNFLTKMSHYDIRASETLYEEMYKNNDLTNPQIILFYLNLKELTNSTSFDKMAPEHKNRFIILRNALEFASHQIVDQLGSQIRCDGLDKSVKENFTINNFEHSFHRIVRSAYQNNLLNFQNVLKFVNELCDIELKLIGFTSLFNEMKENDHLETSEILQLAFSLKEVMDSEISPELKEKFVLLKECFPAGANLIIWNRVCLRNIKDKHEYLYPFWQLPDIKVDNKTLLSWIKNEGKFKEGYWVFKAVDGGKHFTIQNDYYKEYISSSTLSLYHDNIGHRVFTRLDVNLNPESFKWTIKEKGDSVFTIKNYYNNEYLYASRDTFDHDRRYVFTWKYVNLDNADIFWKIEAC